MSSSQNKRGEGRGSQSRGEGISALVDIDLSVPLSPGLGGGEHSSSSAHVTESSLAGSVGTTTRDTRNTSNSSTSSPRFSRCLMTSVLGDSVRLTLVLVHVLEDILNNVRSDGSGEDGGKSDVLLNLGLNISSVNSN